MKRSTERILTTHTGSLPRPADLVDMLRRRDEGQALDQSAVDTRVRAAVREAVAKQSDAGVDVINNGERGKVAYSVYVKGRLSGFEGEESAEVPALDDDFPEYSKRLQQAGALILHSSIKRPVCTGPIGWKDRQAVQRDIDNLKAALNGFEPEEVFMTAASPGVVAGFLRDRYYGGEEAYLYALADAPKEEYDAIFRAGFILQVDCPDLTMSGLRRRRNAGLSPREFIKKAELHVEALNHALGDIPPDRMRLHLCWGNYEGPHHLDTPLKDIIGIAFKARPCAVSFEAANPRHGHEWKLFKDVRLPRESYSSRGCWTRPLTSSNTLSWCSSASSNMPVWWAGRTSSPGPTAASRISPPPRPGRTPGSPGRSWKRWRRERAWRPKSYGKGLRLLRLAVHMTPTSCRPVLDSSLRPVLCVSPTRWDTLKDENRPNTVGAHLCVRPPGRANTGVDPYQELSEYLLRGRPFSGK